MEIVEKALDELKRVMYILDFSNILLNSLILFLIVLLLATIFEFSWWFSILTAVAYLVITSIRAFFVNRFVIVEGAVPELNEKIRTVADNIHKSNPILDSLKQDVVKSMHKIKTSYFIDFNSLAAKIIILSALAFLVVLLAFINVKFDVANFSDGKGIFGIIGIRGAGSNITDIDLQLMEGNLSSILGNKSLAQLGSKELFLLINPLESDVDLSKRKDAESVGYNAPNFPKEIYTSYDAAYSEKIAKQNQEVVKSYFEKITQ